MEAGIRKSNTTKNRIFPMLLGWNNIKHETNSLLTLYIRVCTLLLYLILLEFYPSACWFRFTSCSYRTKCVLTEFVPSDIWNAVFAVPFEYKHTADRESVWLFVSWASLFQACAMNDAYLVLGYIFNRSTNCVHSYFSGSRWKREIAHRRWERLFIRIEYSVHVVLTSAQLQHDARGINDAKQK